MGPRAPATAPPRASHSRHNRCCSRSIAAGAYAARYAEGFEPYVVARTDALPLFEALDTMEEIQKAIADPEAFLARLQEAGGAAAKPLAEAGAPAAAAAAPKPAAKPPAAAAKPPSTAAKQLAEAAAAKGQKSLFGFVNKDSGSGAS